MLDHLLTPILPFDHFLTSVLQVVILLDLVGLGAYFVLGGLKSRRQKKTVQLAALPAEPPPPARALFQHLSWRRSPRSGPPSAQSLELAYADLRRVLDSYHEGLA